jgi:hypothetical protein
LALDFHGLPALSSSLPDCVITDCTIITIRFRGCGAVLAAPTRQAGVSPLVRSDCSERFEHRGIDVVSDFEIFEQ